MDFLALPILHGNVDGPFLAAWRLDPVVTLILLAMTGFYILALPRAIWLTNHRQKAIMFGLGMVAVIIALFGPLDTFNDELFFLHMAQHVVLMLIAAPLLVASGLFTLLSHWWGDNLPFVRKILRWLAQPIPALILFNINLVAWHWPSLYDAALRHEPLHRLEHLLFFSTALLFWSVIIKPDAKDAASHTAIWLLFITGSVGDLIGLTLLLASRPLYPFYEQLTTQTWGLTALSDQRLSGLIMLISGAVVTFGSVFWIIARSVSDDDWVIEDGGQESPA